jgi:hypothetical protein
MINDLVEKEHVYKFTNSDVKKILVDFLVLAGENIPRDLGHNSFYNEDVTISASNDDMFTEDFEIKLRFTDSELKSFFDAIEDLKKEAAERAAEGLETDDDLPDNVWTDQEQVGCAGCGKECDIPDANDKAVPTRAPGGSE